MRSGWTSFPGVEKARAVYLKKLESAFNGAKRMGKLNVVNLQ